MLEFLTIFVLAPVVIVFILTPIVISLMIAILAATGIFFLVLLEYILFIYKEIKGD